ncbi:prephenate dehydratase [Natronospirillum operosum]|uniref:Bifunctional chorismate mutase/prephenate dehydratase n=1 Tax=Natronospirillum operosum TaxID=2759953 RepID=A0A4Z0WJ29_9GAMM|nr:prephenate dehydratase [Natronospirillum operosum]TGG95807.1 prephenate dehydratase [Natronospirillum operosum]
MADKKKAPSASTESSADTEELLALRDQIDALDEQIQQLISDRAACAQRVAEVKTRARQKGDEPPLFYRPEREAQVLQRVMARHTGPLGQEDMARLFREIMSACLALENTLQVAYLGPEGTFTQQAVIKHFGQWVETRPLIAIDEVFRDVEAGAVNYGVVPVENSTEGVVNHTLDTFLNSNLKICGEVELRIHQHLMIGPNTRREAISRIYSHQQSLAQCRKWLDAHLPHVERVPVSSNADAARRVNTEWNAAAIAGSMAAELYDLEIISPKIEDQPDNSTRFLIIGRESVPRSGQDKTSIIVSMRNGPGVLFSLLEPFNRHGIDMTRLETRPAPSGTWAYVFFIDFKGHMDDDNVQQALRDVEERAVEVKRLGSYPMAVL